MQTLVLVASGGVGLVCDDGDLIGGEGGLIGVQDHGGDVGVVCGVVRRR